MVTTTGHQGKFNNPLCHEKMTFQDCELAILRHAVDENENASKQRAVNSANIQRMIQVVERFLVEKKLVCYGGTAINNILPPSAQFYDRELEIPDYDFYSPNALQDAMALADIYDQEGYESVEAKAGVHYGTFKVFVNFIPIADVTSCHPGLFKTIQKDALIINGIYYAPPNFLRMNMYLELSRPAGDVSRWEKVLKRLNLLNQYYPLKLPPTTCRQDLLRPLAQNDLDAETIYHVVRDTFVDMGVVFFGGYASTMYAQYMDKTQQAFVAKVPDFDVLSDFPDRVADEVLQKLRQARLGRGAKIVRHPPMGDVVPEHHEIRIGVDTVAFIYKPIACHSFNVVRSGGKDVKIATMETILSMYLAFYYAGKKYYFRERILCMASFLFDVEQKNRLEQKGVLKRFPTVCYGKQKTLEDVRAEKAKKYDELKDTKGSYEYNMWFLKYNPKEAAGSPPELRSIKKEVYDGRERPRQRNRYHSPKTFKRRRRPWGRPPLGFPFL